MHAHLQNQGQSRVMVKSQGFVTGTECKSVFNAYLSDTKAKEPVHSNILAGTLQHVRRADRQKDRQDRQIDISSKVVETNSLRSYHKAVRVAALWSPTSHR